MAEAINGDEEDGVLLLFFLCLRFCEGEEWLEGWVGLGV